MKALRRYNYYSRDYFITAVSHKRNSLLIDNIDLFWKSWKHIKPKAWVVLPDHFHIIINSGEIGISTMMHNFKRTYTWHYNRKIARGRVWQNRFWDHLIRDEDDFKRNLSIKMGHIS